MSQGMTWNFSMAWTRYITSSTELTQNPVIDTNTNHSPTGCSL